MDKKKNDEEPDFEKGLIINNKYQIQYKLDKGGYSKVYLVKKKNDDKNYAMKVLLKEKNSKEDIKLFVKEDKILYDLNKYNSPFILKLYDHGEFLENGEFRRIYYIMDYAEKGNLLNYITISHGFGDKSKFSRFIFKRILEGIQFCHEHNYTHLDIKPANILLDSKFNPIIHDFGLSLKIKFKNKNESQQLYGPVGTRDMICPQMFENGKAYYGVDADIFALGVLLFKLVVGKAGFDSADHDSYNDIKYKKYDNFWKRFINAEDYSDEFKNLFVRMVAYEPKERPRIEYILEEDPWLKEFNIFIKEKHEEYKKLEDEYIAFMSELEQKIIAENQSQKNIPKENEINGEIIKKSISNNKKYPKYFKNLTPKKIKDIRNYKYFIKIKGELDVNDFMNSIVDEIKELYDFECYINTYADELKLRFDITFKNNDGVEEDENNRDDCIMKIKLYDNGKDEYLLCFVKNQGELEEFYENFLKIKNIVLNNYLLN